MTIDLLSLPAFGLPQSQKEILLLAALNRLTDHHRARCADYDRLLRVFGAPAEARTLSEVPYIPIGLFKTRRLMSVPQSDVFKTLFSSGTSSTEPSRVYLDATTAHRQSAALANIMVTILGPRRLPMMLVESADLLGDRRQLPARGAGVLGMMNLGRDHFFALDSDMRLDEGGVRTFLERHGNATFVVFGFTYMVWQYFYLRLRRSGLDFSNAILVHSGGWKKLHEQAISDIEFKKELHSIGVRRIYNFYGTVEQVGSVFLEGDDGYLYPPVFADVIIRDPVTWDEAPVGSVGVLQLLSSLPLSYPGHSILTEDLGRIEGIDDGDPARSGKRILILGRIPQVELRGCSDTHAYRSSAA